LLGAADSIWEIGLIGEEQATKIVTVIVATGIRVNVRILDGFVTIAYQMLAIVRLSATLAAGELLLDNGSAS
jgi:hypothetical protein